MAPPLPESEYHGQEPERIHDHRAAGGGGGHRRPLSHLVHRVQQRPVPLPVGEGAGRHAHPGQRRRSIPGAHGADARRPRRSHRLQTNVSGQVGGPFMASDPMPPPGWTYSYSTGGTNGYSITATGDNTTVTVP